MIPKELIYDTDLDKNRAIVFSYFAIKRGFDDTVGFSCDSVVKWCGYKHNYNKNRINEQITTALTKLDDGGYVNISNDINRNNYNEAKINQDKFDIIPQFALVYVDEVNKIRDFKKYTKDVVKMNTSILLLVLSYIRVNMLRRQDKYIGEESDKPEFCYRMYIDIEKDIGISSRYISRAVKILNELDLIVSESMPRWRDENDNWHTEVTLFVNKYRRKKSTEKLDGNYDYKQELEWGKEYVIKKKYLNKKFDQEI